MIAAKELQQIVQRRGELLAELFLEDLKPSYLSKSVSKDFPFDYILGFANAEGGLDHYAVEVQATDQPIDKHFAIPGKLYHLMTHSNMPVLFLAVDARDKQIYYSLPQSNGVKNGRPAAKVEIPVVEVTDATKAKLRKQLAA